MMSRPEDWIAEQVIIYGAGGRIQERDGVITTGYDNGQRHHFVVESISEEKVAVRVAGTDLYLTQILYGEKARRSVALELSRVNGSNSVSAPNVEYVVANATTQDDKEGAGFNYTPITAEPGPPNMLQIFELKPASWPAGFGMRRCSGFGIRSESGSYWRSDPFDHMISQAPSLFRQAMWQFEKLGERRPHEWYGEEVVIYGACNRCLQERGGVVTTGEYPRERGSHFVVEEMPGNKVAFRSAGTDLYLIQTLCGEKARGEVSKLLSRVVEGLLPELASNIAEYGIANAMTAHDSEGAGLSYLRMTAQPGPPSKLQIFELVPNAPAGRCLFGIRSYFGNFWRSEHRIHVVSQAQHLFGDETWRLEKVG